MLGALRHAVLSAAADANIVEASDYDGIVGALDAHKEFDLVLLDLSMPGVRGYSGLMFLRASRPELPIIVVSANDDAAVMAHCLEFGAAAFMPKSLSGEKMRRVIGDRARRRPVEPARVGGRPGAKPPTAARWCAASPRSRRNRCAS